MKIAKTQKHGIDAQPNYNDLPLFGSGTVRRVNNVDVQVSDLISAEKLSEKSNGKAEPNDKIDSAEINLSLARVDSPAIDDVEPQHNENVVPHQVQNVAPHQVQNVAPLTSTKPVRQKKTSKKQSSKKVYSQTRNVVPLKFFLLQQEKIDIKNQASASGCSLSNFIRGKLQLPPNETGRKKQEIKLISDLKNSGSNLN